MNGLSVYSNIVEKGLNSYELPKNPSNLYDPLRYFLTLGGKRMRPILTLMGCELFGQSPEKALPSSLAVELFHNFSLIHDDIMDEAPLRRGNETVHTKWNSNIAILSGDVLLVYAYAELAKQDSSIVQELLKLFNKTAIEVCEGQQYDMDFEKRDDVSIEEYIEMIRLKTSVLLGCALEMGAIVAGANDKNKELIYEFGQHVGIAFQIQDDILDLYANPEKFGKQVGGDIISNKKTMLLLEAFKLANKEQHQQLTSLLSETNFDKKIAEAKSLFNELKVKEKCQQIMNEHYEIAKNALNQIDVSADKKAPLFALAAYLMEREI